MPQLPQVSQEILHASNPSSHHPIVLRSVEEEATVRSLEERNRMTQIQTLLRDGSRDTNLSTVPSFTARKMPQSARSSKRLGLGRTFQRENRRIFLANVKSKEIIVQQNWVLIT
jgi:hypothetical protein